jgi:phosphoglycolate phosphatase-like HAD superfamily hydrolase
MKPSYLKGVQALLLDMNSTFMFGEDRFGSDEDFSLIYRRLGGELPWETVNILIRTSYCYLEKRYPLIEYREAFPTLEEAIRKASGDALSSTEVKALITTFSHHERGIIPSSYIEALRYLKGRYRLGLVIDIWAPKDLWVSYFKELGIYDWFDAFSFSSECGCVKPSARGYQNVLRSMSLEPQHTIVIGDSVRRDLGGAQAAGMECVLVGDVTSKRALAVYPDLLALCEAWR